MSIYETEYNLQNYQRSNQDTSLVQRPSVKEGEWVQTGDLIADAAASSGGELSIGQNLIIAYMPWEGYNYEDAILISERLVYEDIYTSIHIESYDVETRKTKYGIEEITKNIPDVSTEEIKHLDENGIAKLGTWVKEGDILVGKVTPINKSFKSPYQKLLYMILEKELQAFRDTSLRTPKGYKAKVINIQSIKKKESIKKKTIGHSKGLPLLYSNAQKARIRQGEMIFDSTENSYEQSFRKQQVYTNTTKIKHPDFVQLYLAEKRKLQVGDKMAGRHGNKGIISQILPRQDMPYLPDGTIIDMVLNPLGVPSRMNVGQIYECLLGLAAKYLGSHFKILPFDEIYGPETSRSFTYAKLYEARKKTGKKWLFNRNHPGKIRIFDGRNGESFHQVVTVGIAYILKLVHLVDDKIHCLTPDHDVLTTDGWIPINKVTTEHKVATLEYSTGQLVYQNPLNVFNYPQYNGDLYHIKNANIDLLVTLKHRMLVKEGKNYAQSFADYKLIKAKDIFGKYYKYLKNASWVKEDYQFTLPAIVSNSPYVPQRKVTMDDWLTFFGLWIVDDGLINNEITEKFQNTSKDFNDSENLSNFSEDLNKNTTFLTLLKKKSVYGVQISQRKQLITDVLEKTLNSLGYEYRIIDEKLTIHDKQLWTYLDSLNVDASNKYLPSWVWELSQSQAQKLIHALCLGSLLVQGLVPVASHSASDDRNGCNLHSGHGQPIKADASLHFPSLHLASLHTNSHLSYYTCSIQLADDLMRLALHAGWSANKYLHIPKETESTTEGCKVISNQDIWCISIIKTKNNPAVNNGHLTYLSRYKRQNTQVEEIIQSYQGSVHCLSVPNEVFYVRRNGFPVWTGNSRSTGPYSLVTQQPLRGRSKFGGQRVGEMEVWALEGYGAAFTLLEMLTIKSDDITGRMTLWSNIILHNQIYIGTPESFKVLVCELKALCLDIGLFRIDNKGFLKQIDHLIKLP
jgi:hypothetical protein